jgi:biotin transport system substrate-specific component
MSISARTQASSQETPARKWLYATGLTLLTVLCARLSAPAPGTPIPITFQVFAVLLSGLLLGSRWGAVAQAQYLLLGWMGAPVFSYGHSGFAAMFGLTGGYLWSYVPAAYVVGRLTERPAAKTKAPLLRQCIACAVGLAIIYGFGCPWFALVAHQSLGTVVLQGALIFLAWDTVKALAAIAAANGLRRGI